MKFSLLVFQNHNSKFSLLGTHTVCTTINSKCDYTALLYHNQFQKMISDCTAIIIADETFMPLSIQQTLQTWIRLKQFLIVYGKKNTRFFHYLHTVSTI